MKQIIFVCLGNICRSPMAEMMMKQLIDKQGLQDEIKVASMATSNYEIGNPPHPGAIAELQKHAVPIVEHRASQITSDDIKTADFVIGMDQQNMVDLHSIASKENGQKLFMAYDVKGLHKEIQDPWYDHRFDRTYQELSEVLPAWIEKIQENKIQ